jgi:hypothetical protein
VVVEVEMETVGGVEVGVVLLETDLDVLIWIWRPELAAPGFQDRNSIRVAGRLLLLISWLGGFGIGFEFRSSWERDLIKRLALVDLGLGFIY